MLDYRRVSGMNPPLTTHTGKTMHICFVLLYFMIHTQIYCNKNHCIWVWYRFVFRREWEMILVDHISARCRELFAIWHRFSCFFFQVPRSWFKIGGNGSWDSWNAFWSWATVKKKLLGTSSFGHPGTKKGGIAGKTHPGEQKTTVGVNFKTNLFFFVNKNTSTSDKRSVATKPAHSNNNHATFFAAGRKVPATQGKLDDQGHVALLFFEQSGAGPDAFPLHPTYSR